jgi:hypothetical protein
MRPGTALVQAYPASRLSPTAPPAHPFPLSVPKLRAFVARDALRTANGRTDHRPKASGHDDPQSARRLPVGQQLVIAFGPSSCSTSEAGGRSAPSSIAAGPCKRLCLGHGQGVYLGPRRQMVNSTQMRRLCLLSGPDPWPRSRQPTSNKETPILRRPRRDPQCPVY